MASKDNKIKLLSKALERKQSKKEKVYSKEEVELALAWAEDEVGLVQIAHALNMKTANNAYIWLARVLAFIVKNK